MKIGIVTPAVMFGEFVEYFNNDFREFITNYSNNNNVPAPSIIAKGLIDEGDYKSVVKELLTKEGLNYGTLPKGLLEFHKEIHMGNYLKL